MKKSVIIIGAGPGISTAIAEKFGQERYQIGLISRSVTKGQTLVQNLTTKKITAFFEAADAGILDELQQALTRLSAKLGGVSVLVYNAAVLKAKDIMSESSQELAKDFNVNVAAALESTKILYNELKEHQGTILFTGGGLAIDPDARYGSLAIGKAGLRNLAFQLHERLKQDLIYVGLLTITQKVKPDNPKGSPALVAEQFWKLLQERSELERTI
jgi:short-subunit dehydrogenase